MVSSVKKVLYSRCPALAKRLGAWYANCKQLAHGTRRVLKNGTYMNRKYLIEDDKKLIYVSNCKVASSSIKASVQGLPPLDNYQEINPLLKASGRYLDNINLSDYPGYFKFTFVRNPFARLASCYLNKFQMDYSMKGKALNGTTGDGMYFDHYLMGYMRSDKGFSRFARKVCRLPDWLCDRHFIGQLAMLTDKKGVKTYDFVGKMEELPGAYEPIREKYGLAPLPHYNKTGDKADWRDLYDEATCDMVYRRYQRDIEAFGYQDAYLKLREHIRARSK